MTRRHFTSARPILLGALASLALGAAAFAGDGGGTPYTPPTVEEILWDLPEHTFIINVAQKPFEAPDLSEKRADPTFERFLREWMLGVSVPDVSTSVIAAVIRGRSVAVAVEGVRFGPPRGTPPPPRADPCGLAFYDSCFVVSFSDAKSVDVNDLVSDTHTVVTIEGEDALFVRTMKDRQYDLYIAFPDEHTMLTSTTRESFAELLQRRREPATSRALPDTLPEWDLVDRSADFWTLRHFPTMEESEQSASVSFRGGILGAKHARGFAVLYYLANPGVATILVLGDSAELQVELAHYEAMGSDPRNPLQPKLFKVTPISEDVCTMTLDVTVQPEFGPRGLFYYFAFAGHPIIL